MKQDYILRYDWMSYDKEFGNTINFWGNDMEGPWLSLRTRYMLNVKYKLFVDRLYRYSRIRKFLKRVKYNILEVLNVQKKETRSKSRT